MKKITSIMIGVLLFFAATSYAQVAINKDGSDPNTNSILHVKGSGGSDFYIDDINGNVGIGTTTPSAKFVVYGNTKLTTNTHIGKWHHVLDYANTATPTNGYKIKTNLPFQNGYEMPTVKIQGFMYGDSNPINIEIVWYVYNNSFYVYKASSSGAYAPEITLAEEGGKVVIFLDGGIYYSRFNIQVYENMGTNDSEFEGWSVVDQTIFGNHSVSVPYEQKLPGNTYLTSGIWNSDGNVGVGTTTPSERLQVQGHIRIVDGNQGAGKVLISDANGVASWQDPSTTDDGDWTQSGNDMYSTVTGKVGIGTTTPSAKLQVAGNTKLTQNTHIGRWHHVLDYSNTSTPTNGYKIVTNLPFQNGYEMPMVKIQGYMYGEAKPIDLDLVWYIYNNDFKSYKASSSGAYAPEITLANENNKVVIFLSGGVYYSRFNIQVYEKMATTDSQYEGWSVVDQAVFGNPTATVPYEQTFPGKTSLASGVWKSNGNVGIGTTTPSERLQVQGHIRMVDGNQGAGKVLISDANGVASWQDPSTTDDGDWTKSGNDMYSGVTGRVGIGTTSPTAKLQVNGNTKLTSNTHIGKWHYALDYRNNGTPTNGYKIKTNIAFQNGHEMPLVKIQGFMYGTGKVMDINIVWYIYGGNIVRYQATSAGSYTPDITIANENNKIVIFLSGGVYYSRFNVQVYENMGTTDTEFQGWTVADESVYGSPAVSVPYEQKFSGKTYFTGGIWDNSGKVGIGTTTPGEILDINGAMHITPGSAPSTANEGDMYMDSSSHKMRVYDGSTWHDLW